MKKIKRLLAILLIGVMAVSLAGCSGSTTSESANPEVQAGGGTSISGQGGNSMDPDQPDRPAEVYGKVKSIEGNVVVVAEMTRTQSNTELTDEEKAAQQAKMQSMSEEERQAYRASLQALTGNNITVTVPVGVPVKLKVASDSGSVVEDGVIGDIQPGKVVSIWTEAGDPTMVEYVSVSNK